MPVVEFFMLAVIRLVIGLMAVLPTRLAMIVARGCIKLLRLCMWRSTAVSMRNLELAFPDWTLDQRREVVAESFETLAGNLVRYAKIPQLSPETLEQYTDIAWFREEIRRIRSEHPDTGILFPTAHMNYFEMCVQICSLADKPIAILARGFGFPRIDAWWNKRREMFGCEVFGRKGGFKETLERLSAGQDVCLLFDQNVKRNHAVFVDFFGIPAATTRSVALAAIRTGAPIYFLTSYRDERTDFNIFIRKIPEPSSFGESHPQQIEGITQSLHAALEEVIRLQPGQWFWLHRRFKTRPEGQSENLYQGC